MDDFEGSDSFDNEGGWTGLQSMVQREIANQVSGLLRNM